VKREVSSANQTVLCHCARKGTESFDTIHNVQFCLKKKKPNSDCVIGPVISLTLHVYVASVLFMYILQLSLVQRVVCYIMLVAVLINGIAAICADILSIFW